MSEIHSNGPDVVVTPRMIPATEGMHDGVIVIPISHDFPWRPSQRKMANNKLPDSGRGSKEEDYVLNAGKAGYDAILEHVVRYHQHRLNNQADSAMLNIQEQRKKANQPFDRIAELAKWRLEKIDDVYDGNFGERRASAAGPTLSDRDRMFRDAAFARLLGLATKQGVSGFPQRYTAKAGAAPIRKDGTTLDAAIAQLRDAPWGKKQLTEIDEFLAKMTEQSVEDEDEDDFAFDSAEEPAVEPESEPVVEGELTVQSPA